MTTVADIYRAIDALAPFDTAEPWDNVGLLLGRMDRPVDTVLTTLDATCEVVAEAQAVGAQLIVTHHPILFSPLRRLDEAEPEAARIAAMMRANLSLIAAHTNLDLAPGGVNDRLVDSLGWQAKAPEGLLRVGTLPEMMTVAAVQQHVSAALGTQAIRYGTPSRAVKRFAVCSGSGGSEVADAVRLGAEVLITGEIKHDQALEAMARGLCVLACGHRETEICAAELLANHLQSPANAIELKVRVFVSKLNPFE